jgi:hypothetical protein
MPAWVWRFGHWDGGIAVFEVEAIGLEFLKIVDLFHDLVFIARIRRGLHSGSPRLMSYA